MTVYCWGRPRRFPALPAPQARLFSVSPDSHVLARCFWQPLAHRRHTLLCLHGLEGSSEAHYMRGMADKAWRRGWSIVLLNQRNCGDTEHLATGLYHSGLTSDPLAVLRELVELDGLTSVSIAGYSLGGNLALKLAGELGADAPPALRTICAVSPTIDLARCVDALERRANRLYEWNFVRSLKARLRRKARLFPGQFDVSRLRAVRTVRAFDNTYTAPNHGFRDAADYYHRASALRVVRRIAVPTFVLTAADDPFVPPAQFDEPDLRGNPLVAVRVTSHGGHCGFLSEPPDGNEAYWAEDAVMSFVAGHVAASSAAA